MTKGLSITGPQYAVPDKVCGTLQEILSWPRPHNSPAEGRFKTWVQNKILQSTKKLPRTLAEDCIYIHIEAKKDLPSTVLFSCHIDTVDSQSFGELVGGKVQKKSLNYAPNFGCIGLEPTSTGSCLGADDGAGVWLMLEMIKAKMPGGYIFHRGEERGGIGAYAMLKTHEDLLKTFDIAVAFDRPNDTEVITHQGGMECASQKFAEALCKKLNDNGLDYAPSNRGVFTDTKVYRKVIPECINLGVGYVGQHGKGETQNYAHLVALRDAILKIDWESLPVERNPAKPDFEYEPRNHFPTSGWGDWKGYHADSLAASRSAFQQSSLLDDGASGYPRLAATARTKPVVGNKKLKNNKTQYDVLRANTKAEIEEWLTYSPDEGALSIVDLLLEIGRLRSDARVLSKLAGVPAQT